MRNKNTFVLLFLIYSILSFGQEVKFRSIPDPQIEIINQINLNDSLEKYTFPKLKEKFYFNLDIKDTLKATIYAKYYHKKATITNDSLNRAKSHLFYAMLCNYEDALKHCDSSIYYARSINHDSYPGTSYIEKGRYYFKLGKYTEALDNYLIANKYATRNHNVYQQLNVKQAIGTLKYTWGSNKEAEIVFKEQLDLIKTIKDYKTKKSWSYINALFNLSISYIFNKKTDSASVIINKGIRQSLKVKDTISYYEFVLNSGITLYYQDKLLKSKDSLQKVISFKKEINSASCHLYLGKISQRTGKDKEFLNHFEKLDSILQESHDILPEYQDIYNTLVKHYNNTGNTKKELKYIKRLLLVDSIIDKNNHYLNMKITKEYDTPNLIAQKEKIIKNLDLTNMETTKTNYTLIVLLSFAVFFGIIISIQKYTYKFRFNKMIRNNNHQTSSVEKKKKPQKEKNKFNISEQTITYITSKLNKFEDRKFFLEKNITAVDLAKKFNTNSKYLAQVISIQKGKTFKNYINGLRIEYIVKEITTNKKLRNYTIKAIAEEAGFNTSESFSKVFSKEYGISPSYFIKNFENSQIS